jgi:molybdopterin-synthase adenylyltransferase
MLTEDERLRYSRQILIPEIGHEGQERLSGACAVVAGLGGLGSITAYYLAAAGVGHLIIVDQDKVSLDNLNRQLLHNTEDIGRMKTESAYEKLIRLNPNCRIDRVSADITAWTGLDTKDNCRVIIDATDNFIARKKINLISQSKNIPFVYGGINGFMGMTTVFIPGETACLECIFPNTHSTKKATISVLGPVAGLIASIQSIEALKILLGIGSRLAGKLLIFDGLQMEFKETEIKKNPACAICGA